ncbi:dehydrogenase/reductase SDR family member 4-like [Penaeus chinensis]|uniref:dehydrogenase/reductase SDR family member 4-like n=1 Tax=Penaeus chinensis TaxID=139456 RepID=UPI001FB6CC1F|nr:dehydrogenase/reductase SDR family member 4-like [Penaeus chinensis]
MVAGGVLSAFRSVLRPSHQRLRMITTTACASQRSLAGKVAIVTASTDGIGLAIARRLGEDGAHVVVSSRKQANVDKAVAELEGIGCSVAGIPCHVAKADDRETLVSKTVEKFGGIDILVSNAAVNPTVGGVLDCPEAIWDKIFEVNVKNALQLSQLVVPHMQNQKGGAIVYVSSIAGFHPMNLLGAYSVSKTALLGLTKAVAQQVASDNIRVNCVAPGIVKTKFSSALVENPALLEKVTEQVPLGRIAEPHEMAGVVSFLCSNDASYITGETYIAAGGMPSRL